MISRPQLLSFGLSPKGIRHRLGRGRLVEVYPGVYKVGRLPLTRNGLLMAAVLACGEGAIVSHESAAAAWGIRRGGTRPIDISIPYPRDVHFHGIRIHRRKHMPPATTLGPLPLCRPLFTLVDLAAVLPTDPLEAAINEADRLNLLDWETLRAELGNPGLPHYPGIGKLRKAVARYTRTDSNLERRFLALLREARLPAPATQKHVGPGRIDFVWPELNLVVETDGLTYHRTPMQHPIRTSPDEVVQVLRPVIERLAEQS